jgi:hypothetical protein
MIKFLKEYDNLKKLMPMNNIEKNNLWNKFCYQLWQVLDAV